MTTLYIEVIHLFTLFIFYFLYLIFRVPQYISLIVWNRLEVNTVNNVNFITLNESEDDSKTLDPSMVL